MVVLYVDDDRINALLFEESLRGAAEVTVAEDGAEALARAAERAPDLLVVDLHLPDTDGLALLAALRGAGVAAPAYLCSADDPRELAPRARAAGFAGCWGKPPDAAALRAAIDDATPR